MLSDESDAGKESVGERNAKVRIRNEYIRGSLGVYDIGQKIEDNRLRWLESTH